MMDRRLAARLPLVLFTINLQTGEMKTLLHSTDWVNHLLFSPTDPTLLMYCHEGRAVEGGPDLDDTDGWVGENADPQTDDGNGDCRA